VGCFSAERAVIEGVADGCINEASAVEWNATKKSFVERSVIKNDFIQGDGIEQILNWSAIKGNVSKWGITGARKQVGCHQVGVFIRSRRAGYHQRGFRRGGRKQVGRHRAQYHRGQRCGPLFTVIGRAIDGGGVGSVIEGVYLRRLSSRGA